MRDENGFVPIICQDYKRRYYPAILDEAIGAMFPVSLESGLALPALERAVVLYDPALFNLDNYGGPENGMVAWPGFRGTVDEQKVVFAALSNMQRTNYKFWFAPATVPGTPIDDRLLLLKTGFNRQRWGRVPSKHYPGAVGSSADKPPPPLRGSKVYPWADMKVGHPWVFKGKTNAAIHSSFVAWKRARGLVSARISCRTGEDGSITVTRTS